METLKKNNSVDGGNFSLKVFFILTCSLSAITLLPTFSQFRYPFFERYLDFFFLLFLFLISEKNLIHIGISPHLMSIIIIITLTGAFAFFNFGSFYFLVEYRQYLLVVPIFLIFSFFGISLNASKVLCLVEIYFFFLIINTLLSLIFNEYYRPGVFGESNYDLAFVSTLILAKYSRENFNPIPILFLFAALSQSRTAMLTLIFCFLFRIKNIKTLFIFIGILPIIFFLFKERLWDASTSDTSNILEQLDRIQMAMAYYDAIVEHPSLGFFGQAFTGITFSSDALNFYMITQKASEALGFNTPSNFHGHMSRGFLLFGIPIYIAYLVSVFSQFKIIHNNISVNFFIVLITTTSLTQSIFSHPFAGSLFFIASLIGFTKEKNI